MGEGLGRLPAPGESTAERVEPWGQGGSPCHTPAAEGRRAPREPRAGTFAGRTDLLVILSKARTLFVALPLGRAGTTLAQAHLEPHLTEPHLPLGWAGPTCLGLLVPCAPHGAVAGREEASHHLCGRHSSQGGAQHPREGAVLAHHLSHQLLRVQTEGGRGAGWGQGGSPLLSGSLGGLLWLLGSCWERGV